MKKCFDSLAACAAVFMLFAACTTTHEAAAQAAKPVQINQEKTVQQPEKKEKAAVANTAAGTVPENVVFAQKLNSALQSGTPDKALALFDTMSDSLKGDKDLQILKASLLVSAGRLGEARALGQNLLAADADNLEVLELNAMIAKSSGDAASQSEYIRKILAISPYDAEANIELAQGEMLKHNYKNALSYYQKSLVKDPGNETGLAGLGQSAYYLDQIDDARAAFQKILDEDSHNPVALAYMGKLEAENENYKKALDYINQAIMYDGRNYDFYLDLGTYSRNCGKYADAEAAWSKAITLDPGYFLAYAYRAGLYDEQDKYVQALADYKKVVETNPGYYFAYESLGMLAWHEHDYEESRRAFELARSINADNVSYVLMIAADYLKQGKKVECKTFLNPIMRKMDRTSIEYAVVRLYYEGGGVNAENDTILRVKKEDNRNKRGKLMYYLGLFYEIKGSNQLAVDFYTDVVQMNSPMFFEYRLAEWEIKK